MRGAALRRVGSCAVALVLGTVAAPRARGDVVLDPGSVANESALPLSPGGFNDPSNSRSFTTLPTATATGANVPGAFTVGSYHLDPTLFQIDLIHDARGDGSADLFQVASEGNLFFHVTAATNYTISGSQTVDGSTNAPFTFALVSLSPLNAADLFFGAGGISPLATTQVDLATPLLGSATGTLLPGVSYEFDYVFTTSNTKSTTHLQLAFTPADTGEQVVPLPGAVWGGMALIGGLAVARQRRRLA